MAMIDDVKILTHSDDISLLNLLINQSKDFATSYCNLNTYNEELDGIVVLMVCERFNKLSAEGISSRSYSSISEAYTSDFSQAIYKGLQKYRKIRVI